MHGYLRHRQVAREGHRKADHEFRRAVDEPRYSQAFIEGLAVQLLINEFTDQYRIDDRDDRRLRRREDAAVDAAQNYYRHQKGPESLSEGLPHRG
ncbi:hypothetical protein SDC9_205197 [bioreactor metagenome]|uniref:Uncharacterized protein n=1 Tax=bioreactor metagenome TaxID=1076179 RepID=A0A645JD73_9ZZZZ